MGVHLGVSWHSLLTVNKEGRQEAEKQGERARQERGETTKSEMSGTTKALDAEGPWDASTERGKGIRGRDVESEMCGTAEALNAKDTEDANAESSKGNVGRERNGGRLLGNERARHRRRAPGATPVPRLLCRLSRMLHRKCDLLRDLSL